MLEVTNLAELPLEDLLILLQHPPNYCLEPLVIEMGQINPVSPIYIMNGGAVLHLISQINDERHILNLYRVEHLHRQF